MRADVSLRSAAYVAAPLALAAGWRTARRVARQHRATVMHGHWVIPGGITAALAAPQLPLVISLHGSGGGYAGMSEPAKMLAQQGFAVHILHYFDRTGTSFADKQTIFKNFPIWMKTLWTFTAR